MHFRPVAAPPGPDSLGAELLHGLAKGLEGLLGAKPVPPAPRIVCGFDLAPAGQVAVTRLPPRSARPAPRQDGSPRGQVVRLPVRSRNPAFTASVSRLTAPRLVRL